MLETKECKICGVVKPILDFGKGRKRKDGTVARREICKICATRTRLFKQYKIDEDTYNILLTDQKGVCAICKDYEVISRLKFLSIDHNHRTGKIRGLLCTTCNTALGRCGESVEVLRNCIVYLNSFRLENLDI